MVLDAWTPGWSHRVVSWGAGVPGVPGVPETMNVDDPAYKHDFRVCASSPAIDMGVDGLPDAPARDLDNQVWIDTAGIGAPNAMTDLGAYDYGH